MHWLLRNLYSVLCNLITAFTPALGRFALLHGCLLPSTLSLNFRLFRLRKPGALPIFLHVRPTLSLPSV
jgi:hypothetical protein